jgi:hypothetical protein
MNFLCFSFIHKFFLELEALGDLEPLLLLVSRNILAFFDFIFLILDFIL